MEIVWLLLVGLIAGWLAGMLVGAGGYGVIGDIVVGILGALIGGYLFGGMWPGGGLLGSILVATLGRRHPAGRAQVDTTRLATGLAGEGDHRGDASSRPIGAAHDGKHALEMCRALLHAGNTVGSGALAEVFGQATAIVGNFKHDCCCPHAPGE